MKNFLLVFAVVVMSGCGLLPRDHDPVMFDRLVVVDIDIKEIDCNEPNWEPVLRNSQILAQAAEWRRDPQAENLDGLHKHVIRMNQGGSFTFCELGKRTAAQRIDAARTAWRGR